MKRIALMALTMSIFFTHHNTYTCSPTELILTTVKISCILGGTYLVFTYVISDGQRTRDYIKDTTNKLIVSTGNQIQGSLTIIYDKLYDKIHSEHQQTREELREQVGVLQKENAELKSGIDRVEEKLTQLLHVFNVQANQPPQNVSSITTLITSAQSLLSQVLSALRPT